MALLCKLVASGAEREAVRDVWRAASAARGLPPPDSRVRRVREKFADPDAVLLLASDGIRVIGMLLAEPGLSDDRSDPVGDLGHVSMVFVRPEAARHGVGTSLLHALGEAARERGWLRLSLWTRETNVVAQALYRRAGFNRTAQRAHLPDGDETAKWHRVLEVAVATTGQCSCGTSRL